MCVSGDQRGPAGTRHTLRGAKYLPRIRLSLSPMMAQVGMFYMKYLPDISASYLSFRSSRFRRMSDTSPRNFLIFKKQAHAVVSQSHIFCDSELS